MKGIIITSKNISKVLKKAVKELSKPRPIEIFCCRCKHYHEIDKCFVE